MFEYCKSAIEGIKLILVEKEEVENVRRSLTMRFENASTVLGTRSFHQFIPLARDKIAMKQCSKDENYDLIYDFSIGVEEKPVNFLFQDMFVASATIKLGLAWSWKLIWRIRTC